MHQAAQYWLTNCKFKCNIKYKYKCLIAPSYNTDLQFYNNYRYNWQEGEISIMRVEILFLERKYPLWCVKNCWWRGNVYNELYICQPTSLTKVKTLSWLNRRQGCVIYSPFLSFASHLCIQIPHSRSCQINNIDYSLTRCVQWVAMNLRVFALIEEN